MAVETTEKQAQSENTAAKKKRRLSKYTVCIIVLFALILILNAAAFLSRSFSDFYVDHVFFLASETTGRLNGLFPFSVGEVLIALGLLLLCAAAVIAVLLIFLRKKKRYVSFARTYMKTILAIVLCVTMLYTLNCNILYCSTPLSFAGGANGFSLDDLESVRNYVVEQCNALAGEMERDENYTLIYRGDADKDAANALNSVSERFPRLAGYYPRAKSMWGSYAMYRSHTIGIYFPFSMEANYSEYVSDSYLPHVVAHEYAHLKGYIYESEANFMSFIACINSSDPVVRYSGYLCVLGFINDDYCAFAPDEREEKQPQISALVEYDNSCYDLKTWEYLEKRDEEGKTAVADVAADVGDSMRDTYMDAFSYTPNYSEVTLLMMQYYTQYGNFDI